MYLRVDKKKIEIKELLTLKDKIKSLRFNLYTIDYGIRRNNKKLASTYMFCQKVDICFTNKENVIIALYENVKPEKRYFKFKSKYIYYLPLNTVKHLKVGEKLMITK